MSRRIPEYALVEPSLFISEWSADDSDWTANRWIVNEMQSENFIGSRCPVDCAFSVEV